MYSGYQLRVSKCEFYPAPQAEYRVVLPSFWLGFPDLDRILARLLLLFWHQSEGEWVVFFCIHGLT